MYQISLYAKHVLFSLLQVLSEEGIVNMFSLGDVMQDELRKLDMKDEKTGLYVPFHDNGLQ